jgi:hypothetical protein
LAENAAVFVVLELRRNPAEEYIRIFDQRD